MRRKPRAWIIAGLSWAAGLLAACTVAPWGEDGPVYTVVVSAPPAASPTGPRLVVREESGNLAVWDWQAAEPARQPLTADASASVQYVQPTWAPTGDRIAWVRLERTPPAPRSFLVVADPTGARLLERETVFPPFYLYWNADGTLLSFLSNWAADGEMTLGLGMVNVRAPPAEAALRLVGAGQPFYYAWSPAGDALLVHASARNVYVHDAAGVRVLTEEAAAFGAPMWSGSGAQHFYAETRDGVATLLQRSATSESDEAAIVAQYQGVRLGLFLNAAGTRLAVVETPEIFAANAFGPLYVHDLATRTIEPLATEPVLAAHWSPDGQRLLYWEAERQAPFMSAALRVWEAGRVLDLGAIRIAPAFFQQYLPFSDQYALSHRVWSPDSQRIVYAAQDAARRNAIYVQDAAPGAQPEFITYGDLAFWSHQ